MNPAGAYEALGKLINAVVFLEKRPFRLSPGEVLFPSEVHMLDAVHDLAGANVQRLAAALGITKGAVSQTLRRLELKGLIRKGSDPRAGRHVIPILTDEGRRLHAKLRVRTGRFRRALVRDAEALGPAERDLLVRFLERTVERLRLLQAAPRRTSAGRRGGRSRSHGA
jgi:DNA-binding MarR family transcriptional regulator